MRTLAIGDIHGCSKALDVLLAQVRPRPDDRVITLGDYVDRGPDSSGVINRLIELQQCCQLVTLRGNHEIMMLDAREDDDPLRFNLWLGYGGRETLASYSKTLLGTKSLFGDKLSRVPEPHWRFLEKCVAYHETETHFFVHANAYPSLPLAEQPDVILFWEPFQDLGPHESGKIMICGHTAQKSGAPLSRGHAICIDTWVYGDGWLTCYDLDSGRIWQANQRGEHRTALLDEVATRE
jgi:calcineurin-like phosphoesterase family protein